MAAPANNSVTDDILDEGLAICFDTMAPRTELVRWLRQHSELAGELANCLAEADQVDQWIAPLRGELASSNVQTVSLASHQTTTDSTALNFGDFELLSELGHGGMGVVYKARQKSLERIVALKTVRSFGFSSPREMDRLRFEAEAAARLDHPHIVPIFGAGQHQGMPFFSMKLVSGGTLADRLGELRSDVKFAAHLLAKVARAVHYAHQHGVLHRDLKPSNILLDANREPMVADFGLAKTIDAPSGSSGSGAIVGTAPYMPPEQAHGDKCLTTSADVYSLGAIVYELLTGRPPFRGESVYETIRQVIDELPIAPHVLNPDTPLDLEAICLKCLEKKPENRYASAADLAADLERFSRGEAVTARPRGLASQIMGAIQGRRENIGPTADPWMRVTVISLLIATVCHGTIYALIVTEGSMRGVWAAFAFYFIIALPLRTLQAKRSRTYATWERHCVTLWLGQLFCLLVLTVAILPFDLDAPAQQALMLYPPLVLLFALAFFVQGSISWGAHFLASFLYMALAMVLRFVGPAAPLVYLIVHLPISFLLVRHATAPRLKPYEAVP